MVNSRWRFLDATECILVEADKAASERLILPLGAVVGIKLTREQEAGAAGGDRH